MASNVNGIINNANKPLMAANTPIIAEFGPGKNNEKLVKMLGAEVINPEPNERSKTKNNANILVLRCAANACFAISFISCLDLIISYPILSIKQ